MQITSSFAKSALLAAMIAAGACGGAPDAAPAPVRQTEIGRRAFAACAVCHAVAPPSMGTAPARIGPTLFGVVGRPSAAVAGYDYSRAFRANRFIWDEARLDAFIASPSSVVRGTRMSFPGEPDPAVRAAIIDYLKSVPAQHRDAQRGGEGRQSSGSY